MSEGGKTSEHVAGHRKVGGKMPKTSEHQIERKNIGTTREDVGSMGKTSEAWGKVRKAGGRSCDLSGHVTVCDKQQQLLAVMVVGGGGEGCRVHCPRAGPRPSGPRADPGLALEGQGRGQPFLLGSALGRPWPYSIPNIVRKYL